MAKIDKSLVRRRFRRALTTYDDAAPVQREMAGMLIDQLVAALRTNRFRRIFEAGCGTGTLTDLLETRLDFDQLELADLVPECAAYHRNRRKARFLAGDLETMELPDGPDLIAANAVFQWIGDAPHLLHRFAAALRPGGVLAFSVFGPENLRETAALTGYALDRRSAAGWRELLTPEFEVLACEETLRVLRFADASGVLRHLKSTGVTGIGAPERWSRRKLEEFDARFHAEFPSGDGGVLLTYHPIILTARKRQK